MKMKRWISVLTVSVMVMMLLAACGGNSGGSDGASGEKLPPLVEDTTPVTIQYWHAHGETQQAGLDFMIAEFKKKYPHITVEAVFQGEYEDLHKKLLAAVAAGDVPAVTNVEVASLPMFSRDGIFQNLSPYIERDGLDMESFSSGMRDAYAYEGSQFGFPLIVSSSVMIYNKTLLDELNVQPPQTWADMDNYMNTVSKVNGSTTERYALSVPGWDIWYHDPWMINGGGSILTEDMSKSNIESPESLRYIENFKRWFDEGKIHIGYGKGASGTMRQMFLEGKIAMVQHSSAIIKTYVENADFEVGVSFVPGDKQRISNIGGAGIVMMAGVKDNQKEAAWKFVQHMTSKEFNLQWAEKVGYLPTHKSVIDTDEGKAYQERWPQYKAVLENFDNVRPRLQHPLYPEFSNFYKEAIGRMVLEGADPIQEFKNAAVEINKVLEDDN